MLKLTFRLIHAVEVLFILKGIVLLKNVGNQTVSGPPLTFSYYGGQYGTRNYLDIILIFG